MQSQTAVSEVLHAASANLPISFLSLDLPYKPPSQLATFRLCILVWDSNPLLHMLNHAVVAQARGHGAVNPSVMLHTTPAQSACCYPIDGVACSRAAKESCRLCCSSLSSKLFCLLNGLLQPRMNQINVSYQAPCNSAWTKLTSANKRLG